MTSATPPATPSPPPPASAPAPVLDEVREPDLHDVARFIHQQAAGETPSTALHEALTTRLRWLLEGNPANQSDIPWGWLLRHESGRLVGVMTCIPQRFVCNGKVITALMSAKWYVDESSRGGGVGIFMRFAALNKRFPLFCTTAAPQSVELWKKFGGYEISDQEHELLGIDRLAPVVEEAIARRAKRPTLARIAAIPALVAPGSLRALRRKAQSSDVTRITSPSQATALAATSPPDLVTALRDEAFLRWRHFECPDAAQHHVYAFRAPSGGSALVVAQIELRGHRKQVRALQIIDYYGDALPEDAPALAGALASVYRGKFDLLCFRGQSPQVQSALVSHGFKRRPFAAPVAWCIDRHNLLPSRRWYLVPADAE